MRPSRILTAAVLAAAALAVLLWQSSGTRPREGNTDLAPRSETPGEPPRGAQRESSEADELAHLVDSTAPSADASAAPGPRSPVYASDLVQQRFHGPALLQREGVRPIPAATGTITFETLLREKRETVVARVQGGRFDVEIPEVARVRVLEAQFEGNAVRFPDLAPVFDPPEGEYLLVGVPYPQNRLRVVDGGQRTALDGVEVRRAKSLSPNASAGGVIVVEGATSPIVLPWIESDVPVWLRVAAPGYAASNVLVDPTVAGDREVALWPSADLVVRVTGAGRARLRTLVLFREEGDARSPVAEMVEPDDPRVRKERDALVFELRDVAGRPHRILAKGVDGLGRTVDLGETRVDVGHGEERSVVLRVDG